MPNKIWVDVEDLFQYAIFNARPSGIQRIEFELCRSLALMPETRDRVGFVRHAPGGHGFTAIPFAVIDALHARLTAAAPAEAPEATPAADASAPGGLGRRIAYRIPLDLRAPLITLVKAQRESVGAARGLAAATAARIARRRGSNAAAGIASPGDNGLTVAPFEPDAVRGDILLVLGSTWFHPFYGEMIAQAREGWGLRMALLIYDIIPLLRPEWCDANLVRRFTGWARALLPQADILLTISQSSGHDLVRYAERTGLALPSPPMAIPIGTGFSQPVGVVPGKAVAVRTDRLPPARSYVLVVSTIEARKNHALLFRVWRRLLDEMPTEQVPTLVFAGRVGWLVDDLMQQMRNANHLGGKIVLVENPQDAELEQLYAGCLFTVFPSFYEGWGLPVTESMSFGRPCIISNASALPEAGGTLARYFDPENGGEATRVIRRAIEDAEETEAWGQRVAAEFRPVSWDTSARSILRAVDQGRVRTPGEVRAGETGLPDPTRASHLV